MEELLSKALPEAQRRAREQQQALNNAPARLYLKYRDDPAAFGRDVLNEHYTEDVIAVMESVRDNPVTIARSGNATGKAGTLTTPILTPTGYRPMGDLRVGDLVMGRDGTPTRVTGVYPQGVLPIFRITFNDGASTVASGDHLWAAQSAKARNRGQPFAVFTTDQLARILRRVMHIPMCEPIQFSTKPLPIDPYTLGVLIGNGSISHNTGFDTIDPEVVAAVARGIADDVTVVFRRRTNYAITRAGGKMSNSITDALRVLGLHGQRSYDKHIPSIYMLGDVEQRKALLAGLMDTDGTIDTRASASYCTVSPRLAKDVMELVRSLGGWARVSTQIKHYTYNGVHKQGRLAYVITVKTPFNPFHLERKARRWRDPTTMRKPVSRVIRSIEPEGEAECVCIRVDAPDALYLAEHCIVTHNTHGAARVAVWFYKVFPGAQVYTTAAPPEDNLRRLLWGEIGHVTEKNKTVFGSDAITQMHVARSSHEFITGVTIPMNDTPEKREARFSGKHAPYLLFIVDEGDAVPQEIYRAIEGCMSGGHARLLVMFNPRARQGPVWRMERDQQANVVELSALRHPNVVEGVERFPGAVTREVTVRRINEMTRPLNQSEDPDSRCFLVPEYLVGVTATSKAGIEYPPIMAGWRKIDDPVFSYMVLGRYPAQGINQLISEEWIANARTRWDVYVAQHGEVPPVGTKCFIGVDVAEFGLDANAACLRYGGWVAPVVTWSGVDPTDSGDKLIALVQPIATYTQGILIDAVGVGAGVPGYVKRRLTGRIHVVGVKSSESPTFRPLTADGITEMGKFGTLRDQLWWSVREWLRTDPGSMLPPDEDLLEELLVATYDFEPRSRDIKVMAKDKMRIALKRSPDKADALCLTFAPHRQPFDVTFVPYGGGPSRSVSSRTITQRHVKGGNRID